MSKSFLSKFLINPFANSNRDCPPDAEAVFNEVHKETRQPLLISLQRMLEPAQAEEVLQESYLKLLVALREGKAPEPRAFLYRVARNHAVSRLRHQKVVEQQGVHIQLALHAEQPEAIEKQVSRKEEQDALLAAINALPLKCRQVFVMRKIDGFSHGQIAEVLGISPKTVENHLARGMRLCREHIVASGLHSDNRGVTTPKIEEAEEQKIAAG